MTEGIGTTGLQGTGRLHTIGHPGHPGRQAMTGIQRAGRPHTISTGHPLMTGIEEIVRLHTTVTKIDHPPMKIIKEAGVHLMKGAVKVGKTKVVLKIRTRNFRNTENRPLKMAQ
jgi:hypothetical protein